MLACQALQKISRGLVGELQRPMGIHQVRWGRRTCKKMPWHVTRKISPFWSQKELTSENQQFLKESHLDIVPKHRPLLNSDIQIKEWDTNTYRTGVLAIKIGVIPQWTTEGQKFYCTLLQVLDNHVIKCSDIGTTSRRSEIFIGRKKGMKSLVVGALSTTTEKFTKMYCGLFNEAGVLPKRKITRFYVSPESILEPGTPLDASHFRVGQYVDAQAKTIGHGFQGVVKRWKFKGGPASHGTTKWHRRPGNIGCGRGRGKVMKGKKMPGHMGMEWSTTRGLKVWRINMMHNVLYVHGQAVPGPIHCYVRLYDTLVEPKREMMLHNAIPVPTDLKSRDNEPEEIFDKELLQLSQSFSSISVDK